MRINMDCVGCGQCVIVCETDAIKVKGRAVITGDCIECGVCVRYCPVKAIEVSV